MNNQFTINIGILGKPSCGKTSLINAILYKYYDEISTKKQSLNFVHPFTFSERWEQSLNSEIEIEDIIEYNQEDIEKNGLQNVNYDINIIDKIVIPRYRDYIRLKIHNIPSFSIDKAECKKPCNDYVSKWLNSLNCCNIIVYVVNIKKEFPLFNINYLVNMINANKKKYDIDPKLIILVNNCDEIEMDELNLNAKQTYCYNEINRFLRSNFYDFNNVEIIPISCKKALSLNLLLNLPEKLSKENIDEIGIEYFGKIYWNQLLDDEKTKRLIDFVNDKNNRLTVANLINNTRINEFINCLNDTLGNKETFRYILNVYKFDFYKEINTRLSDDYFYNKNCKTIDDKFLIDIEKTSEVVKKFVDNIKKLLEMYEIDKNDFKKSETFTYAQDKLTLLIKRIANVVPICDDLKNAYHYSLLVYNLTLLSVNLWYFSIPDCSEICNKIISEMVSLYDEEFLKEINEINSNEIVFNLINIMNLFKKIKGQVYSLRHYIAKYVVILFNSKSLYKNTLITVPANSIEAFNDKTILNIYNLISYMKKEYNISDEIINQVKINITIGMYEFIIEQMRDSNCNFQKYLCDNPALLLFKMNKFWNSREVDELLKNDFEEKNTISNIQFYASRAYGMYQSINYKDPVILNSEYSLEFENDILNYLTSTVNKDN